MSTHSPHTLDRTGPPLPTGQVSFQFPSFRRHILPNNFQVVLAPYGQLPLVRTHLLLSGGGEHLLPEQDGLSYLVGELIDEGSEKKSSGEIAEIIDTAGGYLYSGADWESLFVSVGVMSHQIEPALDLLAEVTQEANYPTTEVDRLRSRQMTTLLNRQAQPGTCANEELFRQVYSGSCYEYPLVGSRASVKKYDRDEVVRFATEHISPINSALIVVGKFSPESLLRQVESLFGDWNGRLPPSAPALRLPPISRTSVTIIDRPNALQTELRLGHIGIPRGDQNYYASRVLNSIFGGKFSSRLNLNLREKHGFTYGISSQFSSRRGPGPFIIGAAVATEHVGDAIGEILVEMRRIQDHLVEPDELHQTKSYLKGVFPYSLQTIDGLVSRLVDITSHDLPNTYYDGHLDSIEEVSAESVRDSAMKLLMPDSLTIVAAGPKKLLEDQLSPLGDLIIQPASARTTECD